MSSSISSSDERQPSDAGRFLRGFVVMAFVFTALIYGALILLDPFATGRYSPVRWKSTYDPGPRTANVVRIRDKDFSAAIVGNSTIQLLKPERLNALTGERFAQLTIPGTGPMEQTVLIEALARERGEGIRALVLGLDYSWCDPSRMTRVVNPFPFWLYDPSARTYMTEIFRGLSVEALLRRVRQRLGLAKQARRDGFWDYEQLDYARAPQAALVVPDVPASRTSEHSAARALERIFAALPANTALVLLHPPAFSPDPPQESEAGIAAKNACKAEIAKAAAQRPRTILLDRWVSDEATRQPGLFIDFNHYRGPLAEIVERDIAWVLQKHDVR